MLFEIRLDTICKSLLTYFRYTGESMRPALTQCVPGHHGEGFLCAYLQNNDKATGNKSVTNPTLCT